MIVKTKGDDYIIWQEDPDAVSGPSILVETYSDCISIQQKDQSISLNYESVDEFCKLLKQLKQIQP